TLNGSFGLPASSLGGLGSSLGGGGNGGGGGSGSGGYGGGSGNGYGAGSSYGQNAVTTYVPATADLIAPVIPSGDASDSPALGSRLSALRFSSAGREGRSTWELELAHSLDHPPLVEIHSG